MTPISYSARGFIAFLVEQQRGFPTTLTHAQYLEAVRRYRELVLAQNPLYPIVDRIVDNRVFLLGLAELYRSAIIPHERGELLDCARAVASVFGVRPADVPVEGYYADEERLTEYFKLRRALQAVGGPRVERVRGIPPLRRLTEVMASPIYGGKVNARGLLPVAHDPLHQALAGEYPNWSLERLIARAHAVAFETSDYSLVGLALLSRDPVIVAALCEPVAVYERHRFGGSWPIPRFVWGVDDALASGAARFIATFNDLFGENLPVPIPDNAEEFFVEDPRASTAGRCVCIGASAPPAVRYYHWGICSEQGGQLAVEEFWHEERWTTARYRVELTRRHMPARFRDPR